LSIQSFLYLRSRAKKAKKAAEEDDLDAPDEAEEEDPNAPPPVADGRKMPDALKKAIAGIKATNPEAAKAIKGLYWSDQEYRAAFPKPADAVAAKTLIDEIGGQEGIQTITAEREEWSQIDRDFAEGKPEFVKGLAEGNPDAFLKTAPHVINEFATRLRRSSISTTPNNRSSEHAGGCGYHRWTYWRRRSTRWPRTRRRRL
jgi:hypothetical protein